MLIIKAVHALWYASAGISVIGAIEHDQLIAYCAAGVAIGSVITSGLLAAYHKVRQAQREEDAEDLKKQIEQLKILARAQAQLEERITAIENRAICISEQLKVRSNAVDVLFGQINDKADTMMKLFDELKCPLLKDSTKCQG